MHAENNEGANKIDVRVGEVTPPEVNPESLEELSSQSEIEKILSETFVDNEKEADFEAVNLEWEKLLATGGQESVREMFMEIFKGWYREGGVEPTLEDLDSLRLIMYNSANNNQIAGREIIRPVFVFSNHSQYQKLLSAAPRLSSRGIAIPGETFSGSLLEKTGMIILGSDKKDFAEHEIRHSFDPNFGSREGADRIIDEAFAYYQQEVLEQYATTVPIERRIDLLGKMLEQPMYSKEYGVTQEDWEETVGKTLDLIKKLHKRVDGDDIKVQRIIGKCKTVNELEALVSGANPHSSGLTEEQYFQAQEQLKGLKIK